MAELETLSVLPESRGAGVGTALMAAVHELARELGAGEVMLYVMDGNEDALRFYERYGMRPYLHVLLGAVPTGD
jgi:ribosomal protein S18 acetylase RimI-like enzyme